MTPKRLLLVEDDRPLADLVTFHFDGKPMRAVLFEADGQCAVTSDDPEDIFKSVIDHRNTVYPDGLLSYSGVTSTVGTAVTVTFEVSGARSSSGPRTATSSRLWCTP